jgi:bifunctional oligoribonuclease and PAP phosphatase NrnA
MLSNFNISRTDDLIKLKNYLKKYAKVILTTHENPDADGVGSQLALAKYLEDSGFAVAILNPEPPEKKIQFLDQENKILCFTDLEKLNDDQDATTYYLNKFKDYGLILIDIHSKSRTGKVMQEFLANYPDYFAIDHHIFENPELPEKNRIIDDISASSGEIIHGMLHADESYNLTRHQAQTLYAAIITDTGSFRYERTSPKTHLAAADLLSKDINTTEIHEKIYDSQAISYLKLFPKVLDTLQLHKNEKIATIYVTKEMLESVNADYNDTDELVNFPLRAESVKISIFIKQKSTDLWSVSLRAQGNYDVQKVAKHFNGGGHIKASGCKISSEHSISQVIEMLVAECKKMMNEK